MVPKSQERIFLSHISRCRLPSRWFLTTCALRRNYDSKFLHINKSQKNAFGVFEFTQNFKMHAALLFLFHSLPTHFRCVQIDRCLFKGSADVLYFLYSHSAEISGFSFSENYVVIHQCESEICWEFKVIDGIWSFNPPSAEKNEILCLRRAQKIIKHFTTMKG